jgi:hypothetical protein
MKTTPWEVNIKNISDQYIAGFLDGDGSIVASIEKRPERRRFPYRVRLKINFTQHIRHKNMLILLQQALGNIGHIRYVHTHNLVELVIQKRSDVKKTLLRLLPFLILKQRQARIMLAMIDIFDQGIVKVRSSLSDKDFKKIFAMAKELRKLNSNTGGKKVMSKLTP